MTTLLNEGISCDYECVVTNLHVTSETARGGVEQRDVRVIEIPKDSPHRLIGRDLRTRAVFLTRTERQGVEAEMRDLLKIEIHYVIQTGKLQLTTNGSAEGKDEDIENGRVKFSIPIRLGDMAGPHFRIVAAGIHASNLQKKDLAQGRISIRKKN